jgi:phosphatidate phosphatase PAH1
LIYCNNNVVDNKDDVYNIIKCIRGQLAWWWVENAYGQTIINIENINMVMLIIIWLLIMIEENINSITDIMSYVTLTNQVIIKNNNLKQIFQESFSSDYYNELIKEKKLILDTNNNYVIDIMLFHGMFKQYMYKLKDIKKTICDCKIQSISLTQAQMQEVEAQMDIVRDKMLQDKSQGIQSAPAPAPAPEPVPLDFNNIDKSKWIVY